MFKDYLNFSRKELRGIWVLVLIICLCLIARVLIPKMVGSDHEDFSELEKAINQAFSDTLKPNRKIGKMIFDTKTKVKTIADTIKFEESFDPNKVTEEWLLRHGLSRFIANNWIKYLAKGGKFIKSDDVLHIYGITDSIFEIIEPYIEIERKELSVRRDTFLAHKEDSLINYYPKKETIIYPQKLVAGETIEINSSDTSALKKIPGIGSSFASRIVKYREKLGGFYCKQQLMEVYGFTEEKLGQTTPYLIFDTFYIKKRKVNVLSVQRLQDHPYITFFQAKAIYEYRKKVGVVHSINELYAIKGIDTTEFCKLSKYLDFSEK